MREEDVLHNLGIHLVFSHLCIFGLVYRGCFSSSNNGKIYQSGISSWACLPCLWIWHDLLLFIFQPSLIMYLSLYRSCHRHFGAGVYHRIHIGKIVSAKWWDYSDMLLILMAIFACRSRLSGTRRCLCTPHCPSICRKIGLISESSYRHVFLLYY